MDKREFDPRLDPTRDEFWQWIDTIVERQFLWGWELRDQGITRDDALMLRKLNVLRNKIRMGDIER